MDTLQAPWWPLLDVNQFRIEWFPWAKRRFPSDSHFDPPFDNAFPTFKSVTECLCVHTYSFNMHRTCITTISKILCDGEINECSRIELKMTETESKQLHWSVSTFCYAVGFAAVFLSDANRINHKMVSQKLWNAVVVSHVKNHPTRRSVQLAQ